MSKKILKKKSLGLKSQGKDPRGSKAGRGRVLRTPTPTALHPVYSPQLLDWLDHTYRFYLGEYGLREVSPGVFAIVESHD
jgi:hypothetical protein